MPMYTMRGSDALFRDVTRALGACLDYLEQRQDKLLKDGLTDAKEHWLSIEYRAVYEEAIELIRPDLCPTCGLYKKGHPTDSCPREFVALP